MKPIRQHDLTDRWIEPGLFISFDNGDVGVVESDGGRHAVVGIK